MLQQGESVVYSSDEPADAPKASTLQTELVLFLFLGSFFIIAIVATFVFGFARGDSVTHMSARSVVPFLWLAGIFVFIVFAHKRIARSLKLTSVVMTERRLFMAPPADYVQKVGWEGPKPVADVIFADQLSVKKGELFGSPCLVFTSINSAFDKIRSERLPLNRRYIPCANVDEAYENLPVFLKMQDLNFEEIDGEFSNAQFNRAVKFLAQRKLKLGQS